MTPQFQGTFAWKLGEPRRSPAGKSSEKSRLEPAATTTAKTPAARTATREP